MGFEIQSLLMHFICISQIIFSINKFFLYVHSFIQIIFLFFGLNKIRSFHLNKC